jgi:putative flippase GtrA
MTSSIGRLYDKAHRLPSEPKRFVKFLVVGVLGFIVDFGIFNLIHHFYDIPNTNTDETVAQAISFACAVTSNFLWNYFWIYPEARRASQSRKMVKFVIVSVVGLFIRTPIFSLSLPFHENLAHTVGLDNFPIKLGGNLALATAVLIVLLWNFLVNRYWTYREVK